MPSLLPPLVSSLPPRIQQSGWTLTPPQLATTAALELNYVLKHSHPTRWRESMYTLASPPHAHDITDDAFKLSVESESELVVCTSQLAISMRSVVTALKASHISLLAIASTMVVIFFVDVVLLHDTYRSVLILVASMIVELLLGEYVSEMLGKRYDSPVLVSKVQISLLALGSCCPRLIPIDGSFYRGTVRQILYVWAIWTGF